MAAEVDAAAAEPAVADHEEEAGEGEEEPHKGPVHGQEEVLGSKCRYNSLDLLNFRVLKLLQL